MLVGILSKGVYGEFRSYLDISVAHTTYPRAREGSEIPQNANIYDFALTKVTP